MDADDEREARAVVARYERRAPTDRYDPLRPEVWQSMQERQRKLIEVFRDNCLPLAELDVLEIGCGSGDNLLELLRLGCDAARLSGIELLPDRVARARRRLPGATCLHEGDALTLPLASVSVDVVYQSTVFSSLLDDGFQQRLAARMWSWVRPGGGVLWYDFVYDNPRNPDVRGVPLKRVRQLFPDGRLQVHRVTLAPPIARRVVRLHPGLYTLFNTVPWLRTHVLAWIAKP
jgi:SAM-dependent methyltransferase